jgi:nucleotide-binding universal stress UspA family protein
MTKRLLIAVDGTQASIAAVRRAIEMADRGGAELRLVHVLDETTVRWSERAFPRRHAIDSLAKEGDRILNEALAMIRAAAHTASTARLRRDRTAEGVAALIAAEAASWRADLILVGGLGRGPIRRTLLGGIEAQLMRHASVPVHPVKSPRVTRTQRPQPACTPGRLGLA